MKRAKTKEKQVVDNANGDDQDGEPPLKRSRDAGATARSRSATTSAKSGTARRGGGASGGGGGIKSIDDILDFGGDFIRRMGPDSSSSSSSSEDEYESSPRKGRGSRKRSLTAGSRQKQKQKNSYDDDDGGASSAAAAAAQDRSLSDYSDFEEFATFREAKLDSRSHGNGSDFLVSHGALLQHTDCALCDPPMIFARRHLEALLEGSEVVPPPAYARLFSDRLSKQELLLFQDSLAMSCTSHVVKTCSNKDHVCGEVVLPVPEPVLRLLFRLVAFHDEWYKSSFGLLSWTRLFAACKTPVTCMCTFVLSWVPTVADVVQALIVGFGLRCPGTPQNDSASRERAARTGVIAYQTVVGQGRDDCFARKVSKHDRQSVLRCHEGNIARLIRLLTIALQTALPDSVLVCPNTAASNSNEGRSGPAVELAVLLSRLLTDPHLSGNLECMDALCACFVQTIDIIPEEGFARFAFWYACAMVGHPLHASESAVAAAASVPVAPFRNNDSCVHLVHVLRRVGTWSSNPVICTRMQQLHRFVAFTFMRFRWGGMETKTLDNRAASFEKWIVSPSFPTPEGLINDTLLAKVRKPNDSRGASVESHYDEIRCMAEVMHSLFFSSQAYVELHAKPLAEFADKLKEAERHLPAGNNAEAPSYAAKSALSYLFIEMIRLRVEHASDSPVRKPGHQRSIGEFVSKRSPES